MNSDWIELLACLNAAKARYLVVGAHAVMLHSGPRFTADFDVWVEPSAENARRVWQALSEFGAPLEHVSPDDFSNPEMVYQIGDEPGRIDVIMGIDGVAFPEAWRHRMKTKFKGVTAAILSRQDLIRNKRAMGRPQDLLDLSQISKGKTPRRRTARPPKH